MPPGTAAAISLGPFDNAQAACAAAGERVLDDVRVRIVKELVRPLRRRVAHGRKLATNLERDIENARGHEAVRREAEILAAFQASIPAGRDEVELEDIYHSLDAIAEIRAPRISADLSRMNMPWGYFHPRAQLIDVGYGQYSFEHRGRKVFVHNGGWMSSADQ